MNQPANDARIPTTFPRFFWLAMAVFFLVLGLGGGVFSWLGVRKLNELATSANPGSLEDAGIVGPVWEFFSPATGPVSPAEVASKVQLAFLLAGGLGLLLLLAGIFAFLTAVSENPGRHEGGNE